MANSKKQKNSTLIDFLKNNVRALWAIFGVISIYLILNQPITSFLRDNIVEGVFNKVGSQWYIDTIFALLIVYLFIRLRIRFLRGYRPSKLLNVVFLIICSIYAFERFILNQWHFFSSASFDSIFYFDLLLLLGLGQSILNLSRTRLNPWRKKFFPLEGEVPFFDDQPFEPKGDEEDDLGYRPYAQKIARKILAHPNDKKKGHPSFAIGINGKWGVGKTTLIYLIKRELNHLYNNSDELLQIDFKPWTSDSPESIVIDFFETFNEILEKYDSGITRKIKRYSQKITKGQSNSFSKFIQSSIGFLLGDSTLNDLHTSINDSLQKLEKRVIIYIDDLDRLDQKEVIEVIRLVRNTASFRNTFFVVAYDRGYVTKAISEINYHEPHRFLEKIFQVEVNIPTFDHRNLRKKLAQNMLSFFPEEFHESINLLVAQNSWQSNKSIDEWVLNLRDVNRLTNSLALNVRDKVDERYVNLNEAISIEILRLKFPSIYKLLYQEKGKFFTQTNTDFQEFKNFFVLKELDKENKVRSSSDRSSVITDTVLYKHLIEHYTELSVPKSEVKDIATYVDNLFSPGTLAAKNFDSYISVRNPNRFRFYFNFSSLEGILPEKKFRTYLKKPLNEFQKFIEELVQKEVEEELRIRFILINEFATEENFKKIISAIFHLSNQKSKLRAFYAREYVEYDWRDLSQKLNVSSLNRHGLFEDANGETELKEFLNGLFEDARSPFQVESEYLRFANNDYASSETLPLSRVELTNIAVRYLESYLPQTEDLKDNNLWHLFYNTEWTDWKKIDSGQVQGKKRIPERASEIMLKKCLSDLDYFLLILIDIELRDENEFGIRKNLIDKIFRGWSRFEEIIYGLNESDSAYLSEFKNFLNAFISRQNKNADFIRFNFRIIPIESMKRKNQ